MKAKRIFPLWVKVHSSGRLEVDTKHPGWIKFFIEFIKNSKNRIIIKNKNEMNTNIENKDNNFPLSEMIRNSQ